MNPLADPFVWLMLVLTVIFVGIGYAVDTYGRAPPKEEEEPRHD